MLRSLTTVKITHGDNISEGKCSIWKILEENKIQTCAFTLIKIIEKVLTKTKRQCQGVQTKQNLVQSALFLYGVAYVYNGFLIFFCCWVTCQIFKNIFIKFIQVTLVN